MVNIEGRYEFHRDSSSPGMQIVQVDSNSGQILEGQIGEVPIHCRTESRRTPRNRPSARLFSGSARALG